MDIVTHVITYQQPWDSLPAIPSTDPVLPIKTSFEEEVPKAPEYTEEELRQKVISTSGGLDGLNFTQLSMSDLPEDFLVVHYHHLRYNFRLPEGYLPLRAGWEMIAAPHLLAGYALMSKLFHALMREKVVTIDPEIKRMAHNLYLTAVKLDYMVLTILKEYGVPQNPGRVIVGTMTETFTPNGQVSEYQHVYLDKDTLEAYTNATGNTAQDAVDYWLANKEQPPF